jgi:hypothetical protein
VLVRRAKDSAELLDVRRDLQLHVRVAEVELDAAPEPGILRATLELCQGVLLQRIEAAERAQAVGILRRLGRIPVVLGPNLGVFVFDGREGLP